MIDLIALDSLKRILDRKGQHAYGVAFDVAGIAEDEDAFDLDLLRDLIRFYGENKSAKKV